MALPKGTFKGLAKVLSPVWLWMSAGWAAYPRMIAHISDAAGESVDMAEVELFSMIMVAVSIGLGIGLAAYGYYGKEADDAEVRALGREPALCPFCRAPLQEGAGHCPGCGSEIPK